MVDAAGRRDTLPNISRAHPRSPVDRSIAVIRPTRRAPPTRYSTRASSSIGLVIRFERVGSVLAEVPGSPNQRWWGVVCDIFWQARML